MTPWWRVREVVGVPVVWRVVPSDIFRPMLVMSAMLLPAYETESVSPFVSDRLACMLTVALGELSVRSCAEVCAVDRRRRVVAVVMCLFMVCGLGFRFFTWLGVVCFVLWWWRGVVCRNVKIGYGCGL